MSQHSKVTLLGPLVLNLVLYISLIQEIIRYVSTKTTTLSQMVSICLMWVGIEIILILIKIYCLKKYKSKFRYTWYFNSYCEKYNIKCPLKEEKRLLRNKLQKIKIIGGIFSGIITIICMISIPVFRFFVEKIVMSDSNNTIPKEDEFIDKIVNALNNTIVYDFVIYFCIPAFILCLIIFIINNFLYNYIEKKELQWLSEY